jgi:hypothetical protein
MHRFQLLTKLDSQLDGEVRKLCSRYSVSETVSLSAYLAGIFDQMKSLSDSSFADQDIIVCGDSPEPTQVFLYYLYYCVFPRMFIILLSVALPQHYFVFSLPSIFSPVFVCSSME